MIIENKIQQVEKENLPEKMVIIIMNNEKKEWTWKWNFGKGENYCLMEDLIMFLMDWNFKKNIINCIKDTLNRFKEWEDKNEIVLVKL